MRSGLFANILHSETADCFRRWIADPGRFWRWFGLFLGGMAVLKGIRLPNLWSASQAQVDYSLGVVKRGLFGEAASRLAIPIERYAVFTYLSLFLFVLLVCVFTVFVLRNTLIRSTAGSLLAAVFLSSQAVTFAARCVGYFDILLALIAVVLVSVSTYRWAVISVLLGSLLGVLIHEIYFVALFPLCLFSLWMVGTASPEPVHVRRNLATIGVLLASVCALTFFLSAPEPMSDTAVREMATRVRSRVDFPLSEEFFDVLRRSGLENTELMRARWAGGTQQIAFLAAALVFWPVMGLFLMVSWKALGRIYAGRAALLSRVAAVGASISPLALNLFGADTARWDAWATFTSFMVMTAILRRVGTEGEDGLSFGDGQINICVALIAIQMASGSQFPDGQQIVPFPFAEHVLAIRTWILGGLEIVPPIQ